jgi:hypothetical protein
MKRTIIIVLVLVVIGVGFYWGYKNAMAPKQQNQINKTPTPGRIMISDPISIPANAITRETTMVVYLDTPTTIFDNDGLNSKLEIVVKSMPTNPDTANKKQFLVEMQLSAPPPNNRVSNPKVVTLENSLFDVSIINNPTGNEPKGSGFIVDGVINGVDNEQVKITLKLSSW